MQNKANFPKSQMNVNKAITKEYEKRILGQRGKNKANLQKAQINVTKVLTKDYENITNCKLCENKPNTNPIKPNTCPPQADSNAKNDPAASQKQALFGVATLRYVCIEADVLRSLKLKAILIRYPTAGLLGRFFRSGWEEKMQVAYLG